MISLRTVHLVFILFAIIGADLFGAWSVWTYADSKDPLLLALGILALLGGVGLIVYGYRFAKGMDRAHIH